MGKLRINYEEIIKRLEDEGFTEEEIKKIGHIFNTFPFIVDVNSGLVDVGEHFNIKIYNTMMKTPNKKDYLYSGWFDLYIDGLDHTKILSVELPKLDIRTMDPLELKIEMLTTDLGDMKSEKS